MELIFAAILGFGIFLVFISFIVGQQLDPVQARLQQIAVRPRTLEELELQRPIGERTIKPIVQGLSRLVSRFYPAKRARSPRSSSAPAPSSAWASHVRRRSAGSASAST